MTRYINHYVRQGDSIEAIAQRLLGRASRWPEIATINQLRYPYISDDLADQLGDPLLDTTLAASYQGGFTMKLTTTNPAAFTAGNWVLCEGSGGTSEQPFADTATIFGTGIPGPQQTETWSDEMTAQFAPGFLANFGVGNILYLGGQLPNIYGVGARVRIYLPPTSQRTFVLGTGALLYIPADEDLPNILTISSDEFATLLGRDLALDHHGFLSLGLRDVQQVSGTTNLAQALRVRGSTNPGELVYHPEYGNGLLAYVGSTAATLINIAYGKLATCFLADPRIATIKSLQIRQSGDVLRADLVVTIADRSALVTLTDLVIHT